MTDMAEVEATEGTEHRVRGRVFSRRVRMVREKYEVDTSMVIEVAIQRLMELAEEAHKRATSKYLAVETRQKWARIEAYIYQVINSLVKTRDSQAAKERLEELSRIVEEFMEEDPEPGEEDRGASP